MRDARLLARLVLVREEAREMQGGGLHDPRNDIRGLRNVPEREVGVHGSELCTLLQMGVVAVGRMRRHTIVVFVCDASTHNCGVWVG